MVEAEQSVIEFFKTINNVESTPSCLEQLCDGVFLMALLESINNTIFNVDKLDRETGMNWILNYRNVTVLIECLHTYHKEVVKIHLLNTHTCLDPLEISQAKNKHEIIKLVEVVLGVIV